MRVKSYLIWLLSCLKDGDHLNLLEYFYEQVESEGKKPLHQFSHIAVAYNSISRAYRAHLKQGTITPSKQQELLPSNSLAMQNGPLWQTYDLDSLFPVICKKQYIEYNQAVKIAGEPAVISLIRFGYLSLRPTGDYSLDIEGLDVKGAILTASGQPSVHAMEEIIEERKKEGYFIPNDKHEAAREARRLLKEGKSETEIVSATALTEEQLTPLNFAESSYWNGVPSLSNSSSNG